MAGGLLGSGFQDDDRRPQPVGGPAGQEHNPLLAVAIAALLVDYRRSADQQDDPKESPRTQAHWRLLARWEQLRG